MFEKSMHKKKSTATSLEKYSEQIIPVIEDKLNNDYIKVSNYYIKCNDLSFDYDKTEYHSLDDNQFDELDKGKINYANIRKSLFASFQTDTSVPFNKRKVRKQTLQNKKGEQPKILIYK